MASYFSFCTNTHTCKPRQELKAIKHKRKNGSRDQVG